MNRDDVLTGAAHLINGDRRDSYGDCTPMHTRIGRLWGAVLDRPDIEPERVALMLALLKASRLAHDLTHEDSWVDGAAYLALGGEMASRPR